MPRLIYWLNLLTIYFPTRRKSYFFSIINLIIFFRAYEKGNLEIHSSDAGGDNDRYCDQSRSAELYVIPTPALPVGEAGVTFVTRNTCNIFFTHTHTNL